MTKSRCKIVVCAVAAVRLVQRRFVALHLMRIGKGGSHTTSLRNSCSGIYFTRSFLPALKIYLSNTTTVTRLRGLEDLLSMKCRWETNKFKGKPAGGHHVQGSGNNSFSEWLTERLRRQTGLEEKINKSTSSLSWTPRWCLNIPLISCSSTGGGLSSLVPSSFLTYWHIITVQH